MAFQQQAGSSGSGQQSSMQEEFTVRMPRDKRKAFTLMKFGSASTVDFSKMGEQPVKLERENNLKEYKTANDLDMLPKFGAGSEYGRELKEESRRKKYGIMLKRYNPEDQPWILKMGAGKQGKRHKGVREGTISENTSYFIFTKAADGAFEAFPVGEWYNFTPIIKYKYLNSEEAEEEFTRRDKTLNYFNIMLKKRLRKEDDKDIDDDEEEGGKKKKGKKKKSKNMILTDMDEWNDLEMSDDDDEDEDEDNEMNDSAKKKKKPQRKTKKVKNSKKNSDDEAVEESDEGDYDDREVDYISDSGSSDSFSGGEKEEKDKNEEKGVAEEKGLRNILDSGDEDEDEEEEVKEEVEEEAEDKEDKKEEKAKKGDDSSSSSSDEDSDIEKNVDSAIFMLKDNSQKKETTEPENKIKESEDASKAEKKDKDKVDKGVKRKGDKNPDGKAMPSKKHKIDDSNEGITEDAIRRYLTRKPMTTKDLLQKFCSKKLNISNEKIMHTIAQLLKKINPDKKTINKKLYLSLKKPE